MPTTCGLGTALLGAAVLIAWTFDWPVIVRLGGNLSAMKVNTALCLLAAGLALALDRTHRRWAVVLAAGVALLAGVTLAEYVFGLNSGIDTLVLGGAQGSLEPHLEFPGRMAPSTALVLTLLGLGIAMPKRRPTLTMALAYVAILVGTVSLLGYSYGVVDLYRIGSFSSIAVHTALGVIVLGVGLLWTRPDIGYVALAREPGAVGGLVRRLTVFAIALPPLASLARLAGRRFDLYEEEFGVSVMTLVWMAGVLLATWLSARTAVSMERGRTEALSSALAAEQRLSLLAEASSLFTTSLDVEVVLDLVTVRVAETLGDGCSIRLMDDKETVTRAATTYHQDAARNSFLEAAFGGDSPIDEGFVGSVIRSGEPVLVTAFEEWMQERVTAPELQERIRGLGITSALVAPLTVGGRTIGVLVAMRDQTPLPYDAADLELLVNLADMGAQALQNAWLVEGKLRAEGALAAFGRRALAARNAAEVGDAAVEEVGRALSAGYAMFMVPDGDQVLTVASVRPPSDEENALPTGSPVLRGVPVEVLATGVPAVCDDMRHDRTVGMKEMGLRLRTDSGMAVAVPGRLGRRGVLAVARVGLGYYAETDLHMLEAFAGLLATALDNHEAYAELSDVANQRQALLFRLTAAQEEERGKIADGVHDDQVQALAALDLRLSTLRGKVERVDPTWLPDLDRARASVSGATLRLRELLFDLEPPAPGVALADALRETAAHVFDDTQDTAWRVDATGPGDLPDGVGVVAYRIVKEALTNVRKHAVATLVTVCLRHEEGGLHVSVVDDGVGMDEGIQRSPRGHLGLSNMYDRATVAGGWLTVESQPTGGTSVRFWLPFGSVRAP